MKLWRKSAAVVACALVSAFAIASRIQHGWPSLLRNARPLTQPQSLPDGVEWPGPVWLDNDTLLFASGAAGAPTKRFFIANLRSGAVLPDPTLLKMHGYMASNASPDGSNVLWLHASSPYADVTVTDLTGGKKVAWTISQAFTDEAKWLGNERIIMPSWPVSAGEAARGQGLIVYNLAAGKLRTVFMPRTGDMAEILRADPSGNVTWVDECVSGACPGSSCSARTFDLHTANIEETRPAVRDTIVRVPPAAITEYRSISMSPDGKRILWEFQSKRQDPLVRLAHFAHIPASDHELWDDYWWISDSDGSNPRLMGCTSGAETAQMMAWSPDSKQLAFAYGNRSPQLYTIDVE